MRRLLPYEEAPEYLQHNPFILHGYRGYLTTKLCLERFVSKTETKQTRAWKKISAFFQFLYNYLWEKIHLRSHVLRRIIERFFITSNVVHLFIHLLRQCILVDEWNDKHMESRFRVDAVPGSDTLWSLLTKYPCPIRRQSNSCTAANMLSGLYEMIKSSPYSIVCLWRKIRIWKRMCFYDLRLAWYCRLCITHFPAGVKRIIGVSYPLIFSA